MPSKDETDIAIVGMALRLPGAANPEEFWQLLQQGREARVEFTDEQLRAAGVPDVLLADPDYVKAGMVLPDIDKFDAGFFAMSPRDAAIMDPQHRVFLEVAWEALEHAGLVPGEAAAAATRPGDPAAPQTPAAPRIGVFAGCGMDTYLLHNILSNPDLVHSVGMFLIRHTGNDKDFLATRVSYQFDLRGPSVNVLTACSTSLVAIHQAMHSLLSGECDAALAGGVTILVPQERGYLFKDGEILAPDGHCRAFDASAKGTIFGSGAAVVVLRRLADALADGDTIHAVIKGSAVNNDGSRKVGFLAPSVDGYAEVVAEALALAGVPADQVQYVEAHGTGTSVGDPIEIEALTQAFRATTERRGFCGIGSVKTNIGHLDTAAGIAGLLKVVLAMQHGELPASLNYTRPNPLIDFDRSPFAVVASRRPWPRPTAAPRIAGVSSLGVGGTNAYVVVGEAPATAATPQHHPRRLHLLPLSAKTPVALAAAATRLAERLATVDGAALPDVAWTLQTGRRAFAHRAVVIGANATELASALRALAVPPDARKTADRAPKVVFLFPGGGAQYPGMARQLYDSEPGFAAVADECLQALPHDVAAELRALLFGADATAENGERLERPTLALPALFLVEYSLARLLESWGIAAHGLLGHSMGEYVAACLAGTFTPAQGMQLVLLRGRLFEQAPRGGMLVVPLAPDALPDLAAAALSLAAANAPQLSVVAGTVDAVARYEQQLRQHGIDCQRLHIAVAAHSHLLDGILPAFRQGLQAMRLQPARRPFVSNVTGDWIDPQRAADPDYWVEHLRATVQFSRGVATLLHGGDHVFVEVGPGRTLASLARLAPGAAGSPCLSSLPHAKDQQLADHAVLACLGQLWQLGVPIDWRSFHGAARRRVPLPTYPFQRQRHWIEPGARAPAGGALGAGDAVPLPQRLPLPEWFRRPLFRAQQLPPHVKPLAPARWLVFGDGRGLAAPFASQVRSAGGSAVVIRHATVFARVDDDWTLPVSDGAAVARAVQECVDHGGAPARVLLLLAMDELPVTTLATGLLHLLQALGRADALAGSRLLGVTDRAASVGDTPCREPGQAIVAGFLRVVPREYPGARARTVDVDRDSLVAADLVGPLRCEAEAEGEPLLVALRGASRFVLELAGIEPPSTQSNGLLPELGVCLITGGLGGLGLALAEHLARTRRAKLALLARRPLPPRAAWQHWRGLRPGDRIARIVERLAAIEALGAEIEVLAADVTDPAAMAGVVQRLCARFGELHGVFHLAGVLDDGLIQMRRPEQVERVIAPKLLGAQTLDAVTASAPPRVFVLFASASGLCGIPGQADYAAANAALDAFAQWRSAARPGRTLAIDWGIFQQVGMVAEARASLRVNQPDAVPPLLGRHAERDGGHEFTAIWSLPGHWQLAEHRLPNGAGVAPATALIELMVVAARAVSGAMAFALRQVTFRSPLLCGPDSPREVTVLAREARSGIELAVASAAPGSPPHDRITHATAVAVLAPERDELAPVEDWWRHVGDPAPGENRQGEHVVFGPRWQCVGRQGFGSDVAVAELALPTAFTADLASHPLHPALLDMAFGSAMPLLQRSREDGLLVPVGCEQVEVHGLVPRQAVARVDVRARDPRTRFVTLDVLVVSPEGIPLVALHGLQLFGLQGELGSNTARHSGSPALATAAPPAAPVTPPRVRALLGLGIRADEGMQALEQALATDLPQVLISALDIQRAADWLAQPAVGARAAGATGGDAVISVAAPTSEGPRDDVERQLAAAWRELLGVEQPGLDQDFFELGGHSLLAVRLFARLHQQFHVDLELATLLSAGTVRKLAAVVRQMAGLPEPGSEPVRSVADRRGQYLVPIQTEGRRPLLFLVHGAGGNVLGFRDLAHYFGNDQPVFGVQARGVDGRSAPHGSIEEMAADYLAEIREVQPHGPYFLGGYSGGGCVAYEMALQLRAVGEVVAFVGMIDTPSPHMRERSLLLRAWLHFRRLWHRGPGYPLRLLGDKIQARLLARRNRNLRRRGEVLPQELRGHELQASFDAAFFRYRLRPYDGRIWLFRAEQEYRIRYVRDQELGWGGFPQGGIEVVDCPGDHFSMCTEPNVQVLCRHFMVQMDHAMAAVGLPIPE